MGFVLEFIEQFESKIKESLYASGVVLSESCRLGMAVSGGADSIAMLTAIFHICRKIGTKLFVITVNHRIRSEQDSGGDAEFVLKYCRQLGVACTVHSLQAGEVLKTARIRKGGIEEAARFLRYQAFEKFMADEKIDFICLAHNQNDNLETILMRFLQGSTGLASCGIRPVRNKFIRPLLMVSRCEIEDYLNCRNISWRTDKTNFDNSYLRNKIRNQLMPYLDSLFGGWQKSVLAGAEKHAVDFDFLEKQAGVFAWKKNGEDCCWLPAAELRSLHEAVRRRLFFSAVNELGFNYRIPYLFVKKCEEILFQENTCAGQAYCVFGVQARCDGESFFIEKKANSKTHKGFFAIIDREGIFDFPFGQVKAENGTVEFCAENIVLKNLNFPFCIRSRQICDVIMAADGKMRNVNDIFSSWAVPEPLRDEIPIVQALYGKNQVLACICGSVLGFDNWIVKEFLY